MLFSIKAASVAERAIERLKEGKKPVIAFSSTMGSFLEDMTDEKGLPVSDGSVIMPDSVSYTHLDVYKRQGNGCATNEKNSSNTYTTGI